MGLLKEKKIDFGVVSGPLEKREGVHLMPVRKIEDIFVAGRNFLEYTRQKQPLSVLEKVPLIMLDQDTSTRRYVQRFLEQRKVFVHPEFELATSDIIVQFALRNLGVGSVVRDFAKGAGQQRADRVKIGRAAAAAGVFRRVGGKRAAAVWRRRSFCGCCQKQQKKMREAIGYDQNNYQRYRKRIIRFYLVRFL